MLIDGIPSMRTKQFLPSFKPSRQMEFSIPPYAHLKVLSLIKGYNLDSHPEVQHCQIFAAQAQIRHLILFPSETRRQASGSDQRLNNR